LHKFIQDVFPEVSLEEAEKRFMSENRPSSIIDRLIEPKEIGDIVAFLASQRAAVINGASIRAEGGTIRGVF
jgi:3-oxoacyl-[acyl-carrier protein] reductase